MADVFISYAREDQTLARVLARGLEGKGFSVWWDRKIPAGNVFDTAIERELESAKSVIVLWSIHSVASEWVKSEAARAAERGVLVPALVDMATLPLEFRRRHTIDLVGWKGDTAHEGFAALCEAAASRLAGERQASEPQTLQQVSVETTRSKRRARSTKIAVAVILGVLAALLASVMYVGRPGKTPVTELRILDATSPTPTVAKPGDPVSTDVTVFNGGKNVAARCRVNWHIFGEKDSGFKDLFVLSVSELLQLQRGDKANQLAIAGSDFFSLLPGERKTLTVSYSLDTEGMYWGAVRLSCETPGEDTWAADALSFVVYR